MRIYAVTLLTMALVLGSNVIVSVHAATPQIQFIHGVASGDVTSKVRFCGRKLTRMANLMYKYLNTQTLKNLISKVVSTLLLILTLLPNLWLRD